MANTNKVQITLDDNDALLYNQLRHKKSFFSAMLNMAYKDPTFRNMFFDVAADTQSVDTVTQTIGQIEEKKVSVSKW